MAQSVLDAASQPGRLNDAIGGIELKASPVRATVDYSERHSPLQQDT
jgi:hypothetical protein